MERLPIVLLLAVAGTLGLHCLMQIFEQQFMLLGYWYTAVMLAYAAVLGFLVREKSFWGGLFMTLAVVLIQFVTDQGDETLMLQSLLVSIGIVGAGCIFSAIVGSKVRELFARS